MGKAMNLRKRMFGGQTFGDNIFDIVVFLLVVLLLIIFTYPILYVIACSFSDADAIQLGKVGILPVDFTLTGYEDVFEKRDIWIGYANSLYYMVLGTAISIAMTFFSAYPFSRPNFMPRNFIMFFYVVTMYFGGGLIPTYLLIKALGMIDTVWVMVIPGCISTYNMILVRTYFRNNVPEELFEAASIDGCSHFRYFLKVCMPLSAPILAVMILNCCVGSWNSYFGAMIYLNTREKFPLQLFLREILVVIQNMANTEGGQSGASIEYMEMMRKKNVVMKYSLIVVSSLPVMIVYPFLQKYFIKGVLVGAIKG